ncbi:Oidioi.mRNA.OKI2018_I69.chr1.g982.t1.cds [Oikopleura dioica]|uniref:Oidioi.mRNA.OKI2018_I69.PAR.g12802.t1.cds n=1 Tax=Oikopleura dioica TaxID=34765 RepID=A0ABN7SVS9_OIKDI|nr:Oidioi.mRNA.OKI2018_I69.PAR.g12802.t1.cds [Oikopleura dioica]CAG5103880.1 Oidioi.mRNA.OKI2018_I69.chr1.g982.t1.cds [Oikopleura dioica]
MLTLRKEDMYIEQLLEAEDLHDFGRCLKKIGKYLGERDVMTDEIFNVRRKPEESLLTFFKRLTLVYEASSRHSLKSDQTAAFLYPLVKNNATRTQKIELSRVLEVNGKYKNAITYARLESAIKVAQIMDDSVFNPDQA